MTLVAVASCPVLAAIDDIPETSGFSGFFLTGPAGFTVESNLIAVPDDYNPIEQIQKNVARNQGKEATDKVPALD